VIVITDDYCTFAIIINKQGFVPAESTTPNLLMKRRRVQKFFGPTYTTETASTGTVRGGGTEKLFSWKAASLLKGASLLSCFFLIEGTKWPEFAS